MVGEVVKGLFSGILGTDEEGEGSDGGNRRGSGDGSRVGSEGIGIGGMELNVVRRSMGDGKRASVSGWDEGGGDDVAGGNGEVEATRRRSSGVGEGERGVEGVRRRSEVSKKDD